MDHVTVPADVATILRQVQGPTDLVDGEGHVVGVFRPLRALSDEELRQLAREKFNLDEIREMAQRDRGTGKTTAEVLAQLQSQTPKQ
jgi:hypothetical protein